jgi:phosphoribosylaminoimidazolecarboxamide formyltransferase/IMP cyclohydrolase
MSAFGGIVALNREVDDETAQLLSETFLECVIAPSFAASALTRLRAKKALRLLAIGDFPPRDRPELVFKRIGGGMVVQDRDATGLGEVASGSVVTRRAPSDLERKLLEFAWLTCKHVKSNAIVLARQLPNGALATAGIGGGQTARVTAVRIACEKAGDGARGSVMASDAFFPFADGLEAAISAGVTAVAQPGGSKKDDEVVAAADAAGLAMVFTGVRHFRH